MRRKTKTSQAEDFFAVASKLPWWAAVALAIISYLLLHEYASQPTTIAPTSPGQVSSLMLPAILKGLATAGQFVLPIFFGIAALLSWIKQKKQVSKQKPSTQRSANQNKADSSTIPTCPLCSSQMIIRDAKRGANAGRTFWGCSQFPHCKGTRVID